MNKPEKIAAIVAITQIFKDYGVSSRFCPVIAVLIGVALEFAENPTAQGAVDGIVLGAMTTGGYGVVKGSAQSVLPVKAKNNSSVPMGEHEDYRGV